MTDFAHTDLETLNSVSTGLAKFADSAGSAVMQARRAAEAVSADVAAAVAERRQRLIQAEADLRACQHTPGANCSEPAHAVRAAADRLARAEHAAQVVQRSISGFEPPRARFAREVATQVGEARATLARQSSRLAAYLAGSGGRSVSGGLGVVDRSPSVSGRAIDASITSAPIPGAPPGFAMVPLVAIDSADSGVTGPESFGKGYSPADLTWAFHALNDIVLPALAAGVHAGYFHARDADAKFLGCRSYSDTYSGFFGDSAIRLDPSLSGYTVTNGHHRIWVAQQMGLSAVPARIS